MFWIRFESGDFYGQRYDINVLLAADKFENIKGVIKIRKVIYRRAVCRFVNPLQC
jgi:hypothetical protein